ncbi:hypothetical protein PQX77_014184 [Marasmius sp. AFHP31]|nr:hypothetical protein PQX77_014184 [Marasmius sp. AFHP31]
MLLGGSSTEPASVDVSTPLPQSELPPSIEYAADQVQSPVVVSPTSAQFDATIESAQPDNRTSTDSLVDEKQSPDIVAPVSAQEDAKIVSTPLDGSTPIANALHASEENHLSESEVFPTENSDIRSSEAVHNVDEHIDRSILIDQSTGDDIDDSKLFAQIMRFSSPVDQAETVLRDCLKTLPVSVRVNRFAVHRGDLICTGVGRWFNDSIINAFLFVFPFQPDCWVMDSLTWTTFVDRLDPRIRGKQLPKVFRVFKKRFLTSNTILIPVNDSGKKHWNAIAINRSSCTVTLYDSLWRSRLKCDGLLKTVIRWLDAMHESTKRPTVKWSTVISTCPQTMQKNYNDCGAFVIGNIVLHAHSGGELNHLLTQDRISIVRATVLQKILNEEHKVTATVSLSNRSLTSDPLDVSTIVNGPTTSDVPEEICSTSCTPPLSTDQVSIITNHVDDGSLGLRLFEDSLLDPHNPTGDDEMDCSMPVLPHSDSITPGTPYDAPLDIVIDAATCTDQHANWSPSFPVVNSISPMVVDVQDANPPSFCSLQVIQGDSLNIPTIPYVPNTNPLVTATEQPSCHDPMKVDTPPLSPITDLPSEDEDDIHDLSTPSSNSGDRVDTPVVATSPDPGQPVLRRSARERKPVEHYDVNSTVDSATPKPKTKGKKPPPALAAEKHTRCTASPDRKESKYHIGYLATLKRAQFEPTLQRPRMGGKVYYMTSYGGQSYFYKAFMLNTKDQDLLDALFEASGSLRSVPDRFAKFPANDSILSKPLMPDPAEAGPPNQFRRKCVTTFTFSEYQEESVVDLQRTFRTQPIVISGVPKFRANSKWDETSLSRLGCLKTLRQAHDASITIKKDPNDAIIKASLSVALKEAVNVNSAKPLNFVDIPGHGETLLPGDMSTDALAVKHTLFDLSLYNSSSPNFSWHIVSTKDAYSPIHMDAQGTATMLMVEVGAKLVFMLVPKSSDHPVISKISYSLDIGMSTDDVPIRRLAQRINYDVQGVLLMPGDVLLMPPATYHIVFTLEPSICNGRHFFSSSTIRQTCWALFHTLVLGNAITNDDHTISRGVVVRLLGFWHQLLVGKDWSFVVDKDFGHTPDWSSMEGAVDFLTIACVVELGPALWSESYCDDDIPDKDIQELGIARDWSRAIFESYIAAHSLRLSDTSQGLVMHSSDLKSMWSDMRCSYFSHIMCCVVEHAKRAESDMDIPRAMKDHLLLQGDLGRDLWQRYEKNTKSDLSGTLFPCVKEHWSCYEWFYLTDSPDNTYKLRITPV